LKENREEEKREGREKKGEPVSLLASITDTRIVFSFKASTTDWGSTKPYWLGRTSCRVILPSSLSLWAAFETDSCSIPDITK